MGGELRTTVAAKMAVAWSLLFLGFGLLMMIALPMVLPDESYCGNDDHPNPCAPSWTFAIPGAVLAAIGMWSLVASVGLLRRRRWSRWAVAITFSLWSLLAFASMVASASDPDDRDVGGAVFWFAMLAYFVAVTVMAIDRPERGTRLDSHAG